MHLITSQSQPLSFLGAQHVCPLESYSLTATLMDINCPGSLEDLVSKWEHAYHLVENAVFGAEIAPHPPALAVSRLPLCLRQGEVPVHSWLTLL